MNQLTLGEHILCPEKIPSLASKAHNRFRLVLCVFIADVICLVLGALLPDLWLPGSSGSALAMLPLMIVLHALSGFWLRAFSGEALISARLSVRLAIGSNLCAAALLLFILFVLQQSQIVPRLSFELTLLTTLFLLLTGRLLLARYARRSLAGQLHSVVRIEDDGAATTIWPVDQAMPARQLRWDIGADDPLGYHELATLVGNADRVVVHCPDNRRPTWVHIFQGLNVHGEIIARELGRNPPVGIGAFNGEATLIVARGPLGLSDRIVKRAFDVAVSSLALLVLLPLILGAAIAIKLDSPGSVFFRQPRIGRQNRQFHIYKFRSMLSDGSDSGGVCSTLRGDARVTRIGRVLRRTSIDEIPQLINVLRGDMSIVAPRPHAVHSMAQDKYFWEVDARYWHRHACKPGMTGLAQVRGHRGTALEAKDVQDRLAADLEYLNKWSLWLDIAILFRTLRVIVHKNAF
ncbi:MAG: sugar transferase [Sphingobium sp.]